MASFVDAYESHPEAAEYQSLDEYLYWVRAFYEGTTLYPRGWTSITEAIVAEAGDTEQAAAWERQLDADLGASMAHAMEAS